MMKHFILLLLLINSIYCIPSLQSRGAFDCVACGGGGVGCVYACSSVVPCLACMAAISPNCYSCANDLCSSSRINEIEPKLTCFFGMPSYACDLHCKCRYNKRGGSCSNGTCYCN
jgi:hypothetical protein